MSEFGRTFHENGTGGTDHGHGSAMWVLGGWFLLQIFSWWMDSGNPEAGVAWAAHVGGFIAGAALTFALRRRLWMRLEP